MEPRIGMVFKGYAGGEFGRDGCYGARVEAFGEDWIVLRTPRGEPQFGWWRTRNEMLAAVEVAYTEEGPEKF